MSISTDDGTVKIYAAASLSDAVQEIGEMLKDEAGTKVMFSFAASSLLARQIEQGAPADIYLSANPAWMDYLDIQGLVEPNTRVTLLKNMLVFVAAKGEGFPVEPRRGFDFAGTFEGRLAMGDPSHVPAGIYGRQALLWLEWWSHLENRLALGLDVRSALAYVERRECPVGLVYATDAAVSAKVEVLATIPAEASDPIRYVLAVVKGRLTESVRVAYTRLASEKVGSVFRRHGFTVLKRVSGR